MSDTTGNIFGNQSQVTPESNGGSNPPNVQNDQAITTMLAGIRNEHGEQKYRTLDDALKALKHSQEYIPQLTTKLAQQEAELLSAKSAASKVEEIERTLQALTQQKTEAITNANPGISAEQVADLVNQTLTRKQQETIAQSNITSVVANLQAVYGTEAEKVYNAKAQEFGMTVAELNALAAKTPAAVLNLIGVKKGQSPGSPVHGSLNAGGFAPKPNSKIGRNETIVSIGATSHELAQEWQNAREMRDELEASGMSIDDLTEPKNYYKYFGKRK
jgi:hypothetical protein